MKVKSKKQKFVVLAAVAALVGSSTWVSDVLAANRGTDNTTGIDDIILTVPTANDKAPEKGAAITIGKGNQISDTNGLTMHLNTAIGAYNTARLSGTAIGVSNFANATALAMGKQSVGIGYGTAIGMNARADGGIAIGTGSVVGSMVGVRGLTDFKQPSGLFQSDDGVALGNKAHSTSGIVVGGSSDSILSGVVLGQNSVAGGGTAIGNGASVKINAGYYGTEESHGAVALGDGSIANRERYGYGYVPTKADFTAVGTSEANDKALAAAIGGTAVTIVDNFYSNYGTAYTIYLEKTMLANALEAEYEQALYKYSDPKYTGDATVNATLQEISQRRSDLSDEIIKLRNDNPGLTDAILERDNALAAFKATSGAVSVGRDAVVKNGKITEARITRQITDVAAGTQDTDAVNVAQLKGVTLNFVGDNLKTDATAIGKINLVTQQLAINGDSNITTTVAKDGQSVNLTLSKAVTDKLGAVKYFSVNSTEAENKDNSGAQSDRAIAIGPKAAVVPGEPLPGKENGPSSQHGIAIGYNSKVIGSVSGVAIGSENEMNNSNTGIIVGRQTKVINSKESAAFGYDIKVNNSEYGLALGFKSSIEAANNSIAMGYRAKVDKGNYGITMGSDASVEADYGVGLGASTSVTVANGVALGAKSEAVTEGKVLGYNPLTGSQFTSLDEVAKVVGLSDQYNGLKVQRDTMATTVATQQAEYDRLNAIYEQDPSNKAARNAKNAAGDKLDASMVQLNNIDATINHIVSAFVSTDGAVSVGRDASQDGKKINSEVTRQITHVAAGTEMTDAVNVAQLRAVRSLAENASNAADNITLNISGDIPKDKTENSKGSIKLSDGTLAINGDGTIVTEASNNGIKLSLDKTAFDKLLATSGSWTLQSVDADKKIIGSNTVKPQSKVNFIGGSFTEVTVQGNETETNVTIGLDATATKAIENVNKFITTDENGSNARLNIVGDEKTGVKVEAQADGSTKVSLGENAKVGNITIDGTTANDGTKLGEISGLTNTDWITNNPNYDIKDDRAATEGQLSKLTESIAGDLEELNKAIENNGKNLNTDEATIGGNTTINKGGITINNPKTGNTTTITGDSITTNTVNTENLVVGGNTYITKDGINANNQTITNVAPGRMAPDSMDAVNGSQLYAVDQKVNSVGSAVNRLSNRVDKVAAGSAALAALHPLDFDSDDKLNFAVGFGGYKGEHAAALGAFYRANDDLMFSLGATIGNSNDQYNAGVSFRFGDSSPYTNMSKSEMANTLEKQNEEIETLKDRLAKLEALVVQK
ncbi:YadA-like family protein [Veillonella sp. R32]|uniref:YadA-like family protein n=1 Tax=Veillonella sp. R32 TaxID=2021312 RepID=UPI00138955F6|nr:YadA-like family protein [Veillonella sp. R32]